MGEEKRREGKGRWRKVEDSQREIRGRNSAVPNALLLCRRRRRAPTHPVHLSQLRHYSFDTFTTSPTVTIYRPAEASHPSCRARRPQTSILRLDVFSTPARPACIIYLRFSTCARVLYIMYNVHTARTFVHTNVIWSLELAESVHDKPLVSWKYKTGAIRTETFKIISESLNSIFYFFFCK